ncbi:MAG TPA: hypothetical protein VGP85_00265 [Pyrinomonadaceae bacterium]|nr:hypothetical protein [Pyrinomonadaceae bacterium]
MRAATANKPAASADIAVSKTADETVAVGGQITYSFSVINAGPDDAVNIVLIDALPPHTTFVSASANNGTASFDGSNVTFTWPGLAFDPNFGNALTATLVVQVDQNTPRGTTISNTVSGISSALDPDASNNSATALTTVTGPFEGDLLISEFRLSGPAGANDEFIELYNNTETPLSVSTSDGSEGWAVAASDGVIRFQIPNGTVIPARGHFLGVNSAGYSLSSYPAGIAGATATGDAAYTIDIPDNAGIAVFRTSNTENFSLATRLDAVGSTSEENTLYKEGTGYSAISPGSVDYSFVRDNCGKGGSVTAFGPCPSKGLPKDTNDNATDFYFVNPEAPSSRRDANLGAPGPENLSSPIQQNDAMPVVNLDGTSAASSLPNRARDLTSDPANNSTFGTLDIRRRVVNTSPFPVTRLRFRIVDITTFSAPGGIADLRPRTSTDLSVGGINDSTTCPEGSTPCTVTVLGTTLEQPPGQPNGGGFNSSLSSDTVTLQTPIAVGDSINVHFLLGVQQTGSFKFYINVEILTDSGGGVELTSRTPSRRPVKGRIVTAGTDAALPAPRPIVQVSGTPPMLSNPIPLIFRLQTPIFSDDLNRQHKKSKKRVKTKRVSTTKK